MPLGSAGNTTQDLYPSRVTRQEKDIYQYPCVLSASLGKVFEEAVLGNRS
jgi:hypothetical protein